MIEEKYDIAVRKWIGKQAGLDWLFIGGAEFDITSDGYYDTWYAYPTISYRYHGKMLDIGKLQYEDPARLIQEVNKFL